MIRYALRGGVHWRVVCTGIAWCDFSRSLCAVHGPRSGGFDPAGEECDLVIYIGTRVQLG